MKNNFAQDVVEGLNADLKYVNSKYLYDDNGSRIFQEIMNMPEYYLTDSEFEILSLQAAQIIKALNFKKEFNIIELGAGDGFKTFKLLEYLVSHNIKFNYVPIDISEEAITTLSKTLKERLPNLSIQPRVGDYFSILKEEKEKSDTSNLLLFLGSNIGNFLEGQAEDLLSLFNTNMKKGDKLLIGIDLKKNPKIIHEAYYDEHKITKRFNINLLVRINREFEADFKLDDFDFFCHYNPLTGEVRSYLVSLKAQTIYLKKLDKSFTFKQNELIWTELSKKYTLNQVEKLAEETGFKLNQHFLDCKHYFVDSLWEKN